VGFWGRPGLGAPLELFHHLLEHPVRARAGGGGKHGPSGLVCTDTFPKPAHGAYYHRGNIVAGGLSSRGGGVVAPMVISSLQRTWSDVVQAPCGPDRPNRPPLVPPPADLIPPWGHQHTSWVLQLGGGSKCVACAFGPILYPCVMIGGGHIQRTTRGRVSVEPENKTAFRPNPDKTSRPGGACEATQPTSPLLQPIPQICSFVWPDGSSPVQTSHQTHPNLVRNMRYDSGEIRLWLLAARSKCRKYECSVSRR
jgi:hypothetical protein